VPKLVDHEERRREMAGAVWRVIRREGVEGASMPAVAREAGCSTGSLRHYFPTQSELLAAAMRAVVDHIDARMGDFRSTPDDAAAPVEQVLQELLPLDAERRAENEVWLAFSARSLVEPQLRALRSQVHQALHAVCDWAVETIAAARSHPLDLGLESARLHALIDGLAVHAALAPDRKRENMTNVLARHLESL
jgi:AcrR family transcriptional regulator